ncbi:L-threonine ammonia-lyase [Aureococcus anophagefferens]|nr:L-threonine ammonia-lyase [Aureococcus anophagefferens]
MQAALRRAARRPTAARAVGRALSARADAPNIYCDPHKFDYLREILNARVYDVAVETPLQRANSLSRKVGAECLIKREDTQPVFSFKIRGAYNKIVSLGDAALAKGVVACSAGNHAQGVAMSCNYLKAPATIVMPRGTPRIKVDAVAQHGGDYVRVLLHGDSSTTRAREAALGGGGGPHAHPPLRRPSSHRRPGSVGAEILRQTNGKRLDAIFCCCGGGGLLAGVAAYVKQVRPGVRVYGVEAVDAAGMTASLAAGERVVLDRVGLFADGAAVKAVGTETYRLAARYVDGMVTVDNDEICAAIKQGFEDTRCVLEPAGALALAGLRKHVESSDEAGGTYVAVASGANMDFDRLRFVSERADRSEVRLACTMPESPGAFQKFYGLIYPCNVTEFSYRYHRADAPADVIVAFQPQTDQFMDRLAAHGYAPRDITDDELVNTHLRHLNGGRSEFVGDERIFRFEFPEAPGALKNFLAHFETDAFNCSLFHYRNYGHDFGRVLVGVQATTDRAERKLNDFLEKLGYRYTEETHNPTYVQFLTSQRCLKR